MSHLTTLSQRNPQSSNALFPPSGPSSGRVSPSSFRPGSSAGTSQFSESPYGGGMGSGYTRATHDIEGQNDERLEGLLGKVKILKDITTGIGNEVRDSNIQLGNMNDTFSSTSSFLSGTFRRMNKMAKRQGGNWCWLMMFLLFVLWIFVVLWWLRR
ncbi:BET1 protein, putative [Cryptococcus deneoformans JEC21]|uniref:BET1 protein, putative n=1 Tax=Cryptococcus deneoformans (strain JEC21 / ATCC MYA-565) TaxID=214684 RepID=Q5KJJ6_CRYD1|nr:BET1 protein, putative [Cryptococcus neoformans var. neoformans JEC21]AAW42679.2 BET1 protein, putative [Cryptococcus neoformans var. neoformans JEC21]